MKLIRKSMVFLLLVPVISNGQPVVSLEEILNNIRTVHPLLKMHDFEIRSMDEAARGARNWMPAEFATGFYMTPYNMGLWKKGEDGLTGMGQYMISGLQMFPNIKKQDAEAAYMRGISTIEKEKKNYSLNQLYADAKRHYYSWSVLQRKLLIIDQNKNLLEFMIKSAEIRYKNGLEKINAYYKAKAALANLEKMELMVQAEILQKKINLNTLMRRDKLMDFKVDTIIAFKDFSRFSFDTSQFVSTRSDLKAVDQEIHLNLLKYEVERYKSKPEFGLRYDHMFGFGGIPMQYSLMGMVRVPLNKKAKRMYTANMESIRWKNESLSQQRQMILNEASGMAITMRQELEASEKQLQLYEGKIMPALKTNYRAYQLAYEQNTEELFMLFDAWETLNMTQMEYLDILEIVLELQVELERLLEIK